MFIPETENTMSAERLRQAKEGLARAVNMPAGHKVGYPTTAEKEKAERFREKIEEKNHKAAVHSSK